MTMARGGSTASLCTTEVQRLDALRDLEDEWSRLFADARGVTPFLHPAWLLPWCEAFGIERLCAAVVRHRIDGRLVAILPSYEVQQDPSTLALLGGDVTDHRGPVMLACEEHAASPALCEWAASRSSRAVFDDVPGDHPWATSPLPDGWHRAPACVCPAVPLPHSVEVWKQRLSHGLRRNVRRYGDRLERLGRLERLVADDQTISEIVEAFLELHAARWSARGQKGVLDSAAIQRFHRLTAPRLLNAGLLRLHAWRLDGRIVAVQHVLVHGARACAYLAGYDPALGSLSVGTVLIAAAVEHAIAEGRREFDFLRGVESYKFAWGAINRDTWRLCWSRDANAQ